MAKIKRQNVLKSIPRLENANLNIRMSGLYECFNLNYKMKKENRFFSSIKVTTEKIEI